LDVISLARALSLRRENVSGRYKVTFEGLEHAPEAGYKGFVYTVHTLLDERKALVMATQVNVAQHPQSRIYKVIANDKLEGDKPWEKDIVDRVEY
jgi:hypothetical protein